MLTHKNHKRLFLFLLSLGLALLVTSFFSEQSQIIQMKSAFEAPSLEHFFGCDQLGRDVFSRVVYGIHISLLVGLSSLVFSFSVGLIVGLMSGFFGGWVDLFLQRIVDVALCLPQPILVITLSLIAGTGSFKTGLIIGAVSWMGIARIVRSEVLVTKELSFVESAQSIGASPFQIIGRHILPNSIDVVFGQIPIYLNLAIITEAGLSFLGLGIEPPIPSLGNLIQSARDLQIFSSAPWAWITPCIVLTLISVTLNLVLRWIKKR